MKINRRSFLAASSSALVLGGCTPFMTWVQQNGPVIDAILTEALSVMDDVDKWFVGTYFAAHPDPAKQAEERKVVDDVKQVAEGVVDLIAGGVELTQAQLVKAESDFAAAWAAFASFAAQFGVSVATPGALAARTKNPDTFVVQEPKMLHLTKYVKGK